MWKSHYGALGQGVTTQSHLSFDHSGGFEKRRLWRQVQEEAEYSGGCCNNPTEAGSAVGACCDQGKHEA